MTARRFARFAVVDWSGESVARPKGLAVAVARRGSAAPLPLRPPGGWSRRAILDALLACAAAGTDILIGLDLSPALPFVDHDAYLPGLPATPIDAKSLWRFVDERSGGCAHLGVAGFLAEPEIARHFRQHRAPGDLFPAGAGRLRTTETAQRAMRLSPSSCFNLVGAAQVGKSSLTGMRVLHRLGGRIPVWPFDPVPTQGPLIVEIYTALAARAAGLPPGRSKLRAGSALDHALAALDTDRHAPLRRYDDHITDAILTTAWLRRAADEPNLWSPAAMSAGVARTEGWTFGVP